MGWVRAHVAFVSDSKDPSASSVEVVALTPDLIAPYIEFAKEAFGADSYQSRRGFLRWHYEKAPLQDSSLSDAKVAVVDGNVVGCFHKLRLPWMVHGARTIVASPHNLFVLPRYRTGTGFGLISECFRGENHLLLLGAGPSVQPIYARLGARPLEALWYRTVVNPVPAVAAINWGCQRLADHALALACRWAGRQSIRSLRFDTAVDDALAAEVAQQLIGRRDAGAYVSWSADAERWRFFSGPRHILVRVGTNALALVSIGIHRSLCVARTVEWVSQDKASALALSLGARALLSVLGVNLWLAMTSDRTTAAQWRKTGFWRVPSPPVALELHRPRSASFGEPIFYGGGGDSGFEALPLD